MPAAQSNQYKFCGNCSHANFNLNPEDELLLKDTAERDGLRTMRERVRSRRPILTLGPYSDVDRIKALKTILTHQTHCNTAKTRVAWSDQACFRWQAQTNSERL